MLFDISSDDISTYSLAGLKTATNTSTLNPILAGSDGKETLQTYKIPAGIKLIKVDVGGISNISAALAILFNLDNSAANGVFGTFLRSYGWVIPVSDIVRYISDVRFNITHTLSKFHPPLPTREHHHHSHEQCARNSKSYKGLYDGKSTPVFHTFSIA